MSLKTGSTFITYKQRHEKEVKVLKTLIQVRKVVI